jgi:hypothetical protein
VEQNQRVSLAGVKIAGLDPVDIDQLYAHVGRSDLR